MKCVNCGASMWLDRARAVCVCPYCASEAVPPMDHDGVQVGPETRHLCPVCDVRLVEGIVGRHTIFYCQGCRGMLVPQRQFLPLIEELRASTDRPSSFMAPRDHRDAGRAMLCPLCEGIMDNHPYGGGGNVFIDTCEGCHHIWLDCNELRRIVLAPDRAPAY